MAKWRSSYRIHKRPAAPLPIDTPGYTPDGPQFDWLIPPLLIGASIGIACGIACGNKEGQVSP